MVSDLDAVLAARIRANNRFGLLIGACWLLLFASGVGLLSVERWAAGSVLVGASVVVLLTMEWGWTWHRKRVAERHPWPGRK